MCGAVSESAQTDRALLQPRRLPQRQHQSSRLSRVLLQMRFASATRTRPKVSHGSLLKTDQLSGLRGFQESNVPMQCAGAHCKTLKRFCRAIRENGRGIDLTLCPGMTFRDRDANIAVQHHLRQSVIRQGER